MISFYRYPTNQADHQLAGDLYDMIRLETLRGKPVPWEHLKMAELLARHRGQKGLLVTKEPPTACDTYKWRRCE